MANERARISARGLGFRNCISGRAQAVWFHRLAGKGPISAPGWRKDNMIRAHKPQTGRMPVIALALVGLLVGGVAGSGCKSSNGDNQLAWTSSLLVGAAFEDLQTGIIKDK